MKISQNQGKKENKGERRRLKDIQESRKIREGRIKGKRMRK